MYCTKLVDLVNQYVTSFFDIKTRYYIERNLLKKPPENVIHFLNTKKSDSILRTNCKKSRATRWDRMFICFYVTKRRNVLIYYGNQLSTIHFLVLKNCKVFDYMSITFSYKENFLLM